MNTRKELGWWLEFAQKNLSAVKKKTVVKITVDLGYKLLTYRNPFSQDLHTKKEVASLYHENPHEPTLLNDSTHIRLLAYQATARKMVKKICEWMEAKPPIDPMELMQTITKIEITFSVSVHEGLDGEIASWVDLDYSSDYTESEYYMGMFWNGLTRDDFGFCDRCGNLFVKVAQKKKKYCTTYCAVRASNQRGK